MTTEEVIKILETESCVDCTHIPRSPIECPNTRCKVRQATLCAINALKTAKPDGEWIVYEDIPEDMYCSVCDMDFENTYQNRKLFKYCPNCGTRMKGESE